MKVTRLVEKDPAFGPSRPAIAVQVSGGTFGVWVAIFDSSGRATGAARPVASGCRLTEDEARAGARRANEQVHAPQPERY